jgi:hypothetical protein
MELWMLLAIGFLLVGIGGILTGIRLSKRTGMPRKGLRKNKLAELARRFASDLAATIERNRRRSRATLRILRLRRG